MTLTLAERLLLLALDDAGRDRTSTGVEPGLAGALLLELVRDGRLAEVDGKLAPVDAGPGHALLDAALDTIRESGKRRDAKGWVRRLGRELRPLKARVATSLVERGVLGQERRRLLGVLPRTRFPQRDPEPERALRERLGAVLLGEREPDEDDALLVALLPPFDLVKQLVPKERRHEAKRRAKAIGDGGATGRAVASAVRDAQAAVLAAGVASAPAASGGDGGGDGGGGG
ncbi:MAG: GOLPH3/VPS74 family protein [Nocardioidaceae bacterium]